MDRNNQQEDSTIKDNESKDKNKNNSEEINDNKNNEAEKNNLDSSSQTNNNSTNNNSGQSTNNNPDNNINNNSNINTDTGNTSFKNEDEVVQYFQSNVDSFSTFSNENDVPFREKIRTGFVTVIDFIFYGKEIKGYTFNQLTNTAKLKVIKVALTLDNKIDQYFPNYKDNIKDKYTDIKGKLAYQYLNFTASLCESVGADTCNTFKNDFQNMKKSFGFTFSLIKELASSGSSKIKDFYENHIRK